MLVSLVFLFIFLMWICLKCSLILKWLTYLKPRNPFWDRIIWYAYPVYIMIFWSLGFVHWCYHFCLYLFNHFMTILLLKLGLIPLRPANCVICDRSCWEIWFCSVSLYTWVKICVHAFLHLQILTYTCVHVLPRRRMLYVQACYLGDLETDWLSPLWASQGQTTEPAEKHHSCLPPCLCMCVLVSQYVRLLRGSPPI